MLLKILFLLRSKITLEVLFCLAAVQLSSDRTASNPGNLIKPTGSGT